MRLADHADYQITLHQAGKTPTDKLVVTFGGQPSGINDAGFGTDFCLSNGWDTIHVAQRHGSQYQGLSVAQFHDAIADICKGRDAVCYGSSLGAYAALYFGGCIDARIIAAAPMLPAWRPLKNKAYADLPMHHVEVVETPLSTKRPVVIFDPMLVRDKLVVDKMVLPAYPDTRLVEVPHGGHTVLVTLSRARILKPIVTALIDRDEVIEFARPAEGTAMWHAERGRMLVQSDPDLAVTELETSLAITPSTQAFCVLINLYIRRGDIAIAQAKIDAAEASGEKRLKLVPSLIKTAKDAGLIFG